MPDIDLLLIAQSEVVRHEEYSQLPLERLDLYRELVFPRMLHYRGQFRSHLDVINLCRGETLPHDGPPSPRSAPLSVWNLPSCAAIHLANYLLANGLRTCIINNFDAEWDRFRAVYSACRQPPLVGISTTFHLAWSELKRMVSKLRGFAPDMEIAAGGAFLNAQTLAAEPAAFEQPMRRIGIDYVLHGFHSERDLLALLRARRGGDLSQVANLAYVDRKPSPAEFHATPSQWNAPVLGEVPFLWEQLELPFVRGTLQVRTSCGCPFSCAFCSYPKVAHGFQTMDADAVARLLESAFRVPGVRRLCFIDDTFNVPVPRFQEICRLLEPYQRQWYSFLRVQFLDEETAAFMERSGCRAVYLGIESANDVVLGNMNKRATRKDFERGVALLKKHGIASVAAFVLGFPGETEDSIRDDIDFIENSGVDFYTLKEFYYMAHTPVHERRERYQLVGMGNQWAHATMDSATAYRFKTEMFQTIRNAVFVDADTSLWYLVALCDAGFSIDEIKRLQREINLVTQEQMRGQFSDAHPAFDRLQELLSRTV
jgi:anaerobic magnesium-protoporphyrin IX monomethyl ester cyclase